VKYKKGDLVRLSDFGKLIVGEADCDVGMILEGPYDLSVKTGDVVTTYYIAYDILVGSELMKRVPAEFLKRMTKDEENIARMEKMVDGDETD
tara:strand:- start:2568 stop:2843 length:276 start_codon:yes stop_codon:yes gene_type:complete